MQKRLIWFIIVPAFSVMGLLMLKLMGVVEFSDLGPSGDFFNGIFGPFIGVLVAFITYNAWQAQIRANEIQMKALKSSEINNQVMMFINLMNNFIDRQSVQSKQGLQAINLIHGDAIHKRNVINEQTLMNSDGSVIWQNFSKIKSNYSEHKEKTDQIFIREIFEVIKKDSGFALASAIYVNPEYEFLKNIREILGSGVLLLQTQELNKELNSDFFSQSYNLISLSISNNLKQLLKLELHLIKGEENAKLCSLYKKVGILDAKDL